MNHFAALYRQMNDRRVLRMSEIQSHTAAICRCDSYHEYESPIPTEDRLVARGLMVDEAEATGKMRQRSGSSA